MASMVSVGLVPAASLAACGAGLPPGSFALILLATGVRWEGSGDA